MTSPSPYEITNLRISLKFSPTQHALLSESQNWYAVTQALIDEARAAKLAPYQVNTGSAGAVALSNLDYMDMELMSLGRLFSHSELDAPIMSVKTDTSIAALVTVPVGLKEEAVKDRTESETLLAAQVLTGTKKTKGMMEIPIDLFTMLRMLLLACEKVIGELDVTIERQLGIRINKGLTTVELPKLMELDTKKFGSQYEGASLQEIKLSTVGTPSRQLLADRDGRLSESIKGLSLRGKAFFIADEIEKSTIAGLADLKTNFLRLR